MGGVGSRGDTQANVGTHTIHFYQFKNHNTTVSRTVARTVGLSLDVWRGEGLNIVTMVNNPCPSPSLPLFEMDTTDTACILCDSERGAEGGLRGLER